MLNLLNPFIKHSAFEKNRITLTRPTLDSPAQQAMKNIICTFCGQDQQTRAQIAFASIIKCLQLSASKNNWIYLLKNLIILDRLTGENSFCQEISALSIPNIQRYQNQDIRANAIGASNILKNYWHLIRKISHIKLSKCHILFYKRSLRKSFLSTLSTHQVLQQIQILQDFFSMAYYLISKVSGSSIEDQENIRKTQSHTDNNNTKYSTEFYNSKLAEYLIMHFYAKMLTFYSCQYLCIYRFIDILLHHTKNDQIILEDVKKFSKMASLFRLNSNDMIFISERYKHMKGFQHVDSKQFSAFSQQNILETVQQYLNQKNKFQEFKKKLQPLQLQNSQVDCLRVDLKPYSQCLNESQINTPRKKLAFSRDKSTSNQFQNYISSTSESFPQKQVMTLDLIMQIRKEQAEQLQKLNINNYARKETHQSKSDISEKQNQQTLHDKFLKQKQKVNIRDILIWDREYDAEKDKKSLQKPNYILLKQSLFSCLDMKFIPNESQSWRNSSI